MEKALIIIGIVSLPIFVVCLALYAVAKFLIAYYEPAADSNAALKNWLLSHPGRDVDDYLAGVR